ncbi:MAG: hypothetical protein ACYC91_14400 [Solirubrobacteraceae bacterium]
MGRRAKTWATSCCVLAAGLLLGAGDAGAGPSGPTAIKHCSTAALSRAVSAGGAWIFECSGTITSPAPRSAPATQLGPGWSVGRSLTLDVAPNQSVTLSGGETSTAESTVSWRIFTVAAHAALTLRNLTLSNDVSAPSGTAVQANTGGDNGVDGGPGSSGGKGVDGGFGSPGTAGGIAQGGAIYNRGTLELVNVVADGVAIQGGKGGSGATGGDGGNGGSGGTASPGPVQTCPSPGGGGGTYPISTQGGPGGGGGNGGNGGPGMDGGPGGGAQGGAIYNTGKLIAEATSFSSDSAQGGLGGDGGGGGNGGNGGTAGDGWPGGTGGSGGIGVSGGNAGDGGAAQGGAIYNTGTVTLFDSTFSGAQVDGGFSGNGGDAGNGGDGGAGGFGLGYSSCNSDGLTTAGGSGGNGAQAGSGGSGANGGLAQGGAIYNKGKVQELGTSFGNDGLTVGLGAHPTSSCGGNESIPCIGKKGKGGTGGSGSTGSGSPGSNGQNGPSGTKNGNTGKPGKSAGKNIFGAAAVKLTPNGHASVGKIRPYGRGVSAELKCRGSSKQACVIVVSIVFAAPFGHSIVLGSGNFPLLARTSTIAIVTLNQVGQTLLAHLPGGHVTVFVDQLMGKKHRRLAAQSVKL